MFRETPKKGVRNPFPLVIMYSETISNMRVLKIFGQYILVNLESHINYLQRLGSNPEPPPRYLSHEGSVTFCDPFIQMILWTAVLCKWKRMDASHTAIIGSIS